MNEPMSTETIVSKYFESHSVIEMEKQLPYFLGAASDLLVQYSDEHEQGKWEKAMKILDFSHLIIDYLEHERKQA